MTKLEQAARQALEALVKSTGELHRFLTSPTDMQLITNHKAITALREALAEQAEQERKYGELAGTHNWTPPNYTDEQWQKLDQEYQDHVAEQEPVAYMFKVKRTLPSSTRLDVFAAIEHHPLPHEDIISKEPLYAAPIRTKDLTDDEIDALVDDACVSQMPMDMFARAVIAADREKNK